MLSKGAGLLIPSASSTSLRLDVMGLMQNMLPVTRNALEMS